MSRSVGKAFSMTLSWGMLLTKVATMPYGNPPQGLLGDRCAQLA